MSLRPLTPQSPARIEWEQSVTLHIEQMADMTTSDVQGMLEADPDGVDRVFNDGHKPLEAARILLGTDPERDGLDILNAEGFKLLEAESDSGATLPRKLFEMQLGERFTYLGKPDRVYVLLDRGECGLVAHAPDGTRKSLQGVYSAADTAHEFRELLVLPVPADDGVKELRDELAQVKRSNVHALASLGEAREERDKLRALAVELLSALQFARSWFNSTDPNAEPQAHEVISKSDATISAAKEHGL